MSAAWRDLRDLAAGDRVPAELYVLDYRDGERPRWTVHQVEELVTGGRRLILMDPDNAESLDLFDPKGCAAVTVITHPRKTLRSQPHRLGGECGNMLCDLDQQGRRVAGARVAT